MAKFIRLSILLLGITWFGIPPAIGSAQENTVTLQDAVNGYESVTNGSAGVPHDWTHRHLLFSLPPRNTTSYSKVTKDPRFWQQQLWRLRHQSQNGGEFSLNAQLTMPPVKNTKSKTKVTKDWSVGMGSNASVGTVAYPAKYSISTTAASCSDYVAYNTSSAGTQVSTATFSTSNNNVPNSGDTVTVGSTTYTFVNSPSSANQVQIGPDSGGDSPKESAANLQAAINANTNQCILGNQCFGTGTTANTSASATVELNVTTITAKTRGTGGNFTFSANASNRISTSSNPATSTAPSIIGFSNLYSGCSGSGSVPTTSWSYNTNGNVTTSPVVSLDGSQIAFVESEAGVAHLILLKWKNGAGQGTIGTPVTPTSVTAAGYRAHAAACFLDLTFNGSPNDSHSDPFYNYSTDTLYVGSNDGKLHKFTGVFNGTPAEVTNTWPLTVHSNAALTSPIFDSVSGNLFMWDSEGILSYVREVGSTIGTCKSGSTPCLGATTVNLEVDGGSGTGQVSIDSPMVDSNSHRVFAFVPCASTAGDNGCGDPSSDDSPSEVVQASTDLLTVHRQQIGGSSIFDRVYNGDFDDNYYAGQYSTGNLYACGNPRIDEARTIYRLSFDSSGNLNSVHTGPTITSNGSSSCSPMTEFSNNGTDRLFVSVTSGGNDTGCSGACIYSYNITSALSSSSNAAAGLAVTGGTSGIVIDNNQSSPSGASQVYFSNLGNAGSCGTTGSGGCAVQASQSGLN